MNHLTRTEEEPSLHISIRFKRNAGCIHRWSRGKTIDDAVVIGEQEGGLYKLKGHPEQALVHDTVDPSEHWHRRLAHVH